MPTGFAFRQKLQGTWWRADRPPGAGGPRGGGEIELDLALEIPSLRRFLLDPTARVDGSVDARGLADRQPIRGTLEVLPIFRRKLVYELRFPADRGDGELRLHGEAELDPFHLVEGTAQLRAGILEDDREVAEAELTLHLKDELLRLVRSFRRR